MGSATSEFQMSCTINQRPFSFTQRTMYFPESAAGSPGGRLAVAGQPKCQRPSSSACGPLAQTDSAHTRRMGGGLRSEEHTSELQSQSNLVCRLLLEKKKKKKRKKKKIKKSTITNNNH